MLPDATRKQWCEGGQNRYHALGQGAHLDHLFQRTLVTNAPYPFPP
jgi:hypothetical protein